MCGVSAFENRQNPESHGESVRVGSYVYIYIYIYNVYVCVYMCVNVCVSFQLIKRILLQKPGGVTILEYEETESICDSSRRQMVNMLAAHMTETEGYIIP